jgi:ADP-heptose:LPS heptosyltransferase
MGIIRPLKSLGRRALPAYIIDHIQSRLAAARLVAPAVVAHLPLLMRYFLNVRKGKTLVVLERSGGMGDLICLLACVPGLRAKHPNSWVALITPYGCAQLAVASKLCDAATETHTSFHHLLRYTCSPQCYYVPLLPDDRVPSQPQSRLHLAEEFAQVLGISADLDSVNLRVPERERGRMIKRLRAVNPEGRPIIVIHSGPTWPVRDWPIERWFELVEKIAAKGSVIIHVGMDFDSYRRRVQPRPIPNTINWVNALNLMGLTALLEQTNVFIGIDSGPLHIATALGVPSVGLFGPTEGRLRVHPRAQVAILTGTASCLGCHHRGSEPRHWRTGCVNNIACMAEITADQVFSAVSSALKGNDRGIE